MSYLDVYYGLHKEAGMKKEALMPLNKALPAIKEFLKGSKGLGGARMFQGLNRPQIFSQSINKHNRKLKDILNRYVNHREINDKASPLFIGNNGFISNNMKKLIRAVQSNEMPSRIGGISPMNAALTKRHLTSYRNKEIKDLLSTIGLDPLAMDKLKDLVNTTNRRF